MIKVELQTAGGGLVTRGLIPPFTPGNMPEVITWGIRFFVAATVDPAGEYAIYREAFTVALVTGEDGTFI